MSDSEKLNAILQELKSLSVRVENIEKRQDIQPTLPTTSQNGASHVKEGDDETRDDQRPHIHLPTVGLAVGSGDIQRQFEIIKDSVSRQTLPTNLKVHDTATGIKNECRPALKIIKKSARYTETALKILASLESPTPVTVAYDNKDINNLYCVLAAQINFLQSEFSGILVRSNFNEETSRIFKSLEATNAPFSQQSLNNLKISAELAAVSARSSNSNRGRGFRGSYDRFQRGAGRRRSFSSFPGRPFSQDIPSTEFNSGGN